MASSQMFPPRILALPDGNGEVPSHRLTAPGCDVLITRASAGGTLPMHAHDTENATVIISGETVVVTAEGERRCGPGEWYETSPGQHHAIRFNVDTVQIEFRFAPA